MLDILVRINLFHKVHVEPICHDYSVIFLNFKVSSRDKNEFIVILKIFGFRFKGFRIQLQCFSLLIKTVLSIGPSLPWHFDIQFQLFLDLEPGTGIIIPDSGSNFYLRILLQPDVLLKCPNFLYLYFTSFWNFNQYV